MQCDVHVNEKVRSVFCDGGTSLLYVLQNDFLLNRPKLAHLCE